VSPRNPSPHSRLIVSRNVRAGSSHSAGPTKGRASSASRAGLGGTIAGGRQFVSWIHERDFTRAIELLIARDDLDGPVNLASPSPLPQRDFMAALRAAKGMRLGLPATKWMVEIGAFFLRTDSELILKSRRVVPGRLLDAGFRFDFPEWAPAAQDLVARWH
jgi:hypothetical protein